jgi:hypothetical protein
MKHGSLLNSSSPEDGSQFQQRFRIVVRVEYRESMAHHAQEYDTSSPDIDS